MIIDYFNPLNSFYTYDVTNFVKSMITNSDPNAAGNGLILSVPPPGSTGGFNRVIIPDQTYPIQERITLSVYYISLFPHL